MPGDRGRFPWVLASLLAGILVAAGLWMVRAPGPEFQSLAPRLRPTDGTPKGQGREAPVALAALPAADEAAGLRTELALQDPTPLFFPTEFNSGRVDTAMVAEQSFGTAFGRAIDSKLHYPPKDNRLEVPDAVVVPTDPLRALARVDRPVTLVELARAEEPVTALPARWARIDVRQLGTGRLLHSLDIPTSAVAITGEVVPMEVLLAITPSGLLSDPTALGASGGPTMDLATVAEILRSVRLGAVMGPGIYRICLGP